MNKIIICPNEIKLKLLKTNNPLNHIKYFSKEDLIDNLTFKVDYDSAVYISKMYNYRIELAKELVDNLHFINDKNKTDKLEIMNNIYNDLLSQGLIKRNNLFKNLFIDKCVEIIGYSKKDKEIPYLLDSINVSYEYGEIDTSFYEHKCMIAKDKTEEIQYVFTQIFNLIENGVDLNHIYIYSYADEYHNDLNKYAYYHNIFIDYERKIKLFDSPIYAKFKAFYEESGDIEVSYDKLKETLKIDNFDALGRIVKAVSKINHLNLEKNEFINALDNISKKIYLKDIKYDPSIKICNSNNYLSNDDYCFMIGFDQNNYPKVVKDVSFLNDNEKALLNMNDSKTETEINEEMLVNFINRTKNLFISYKEKDGKTIYYPSSLIDKCNMKTEHIKDEYIRYSRDLAKVEVSKQLDLKTNYGIIENLVDNLAYDMKEYKSYDHSLKLDNYTNDNFLRISYTQINDYNSCPFKYFASRVLNLSDVEDSFNMKLGTFFHKVLEESLSKETKFEDYNSYIEENFQTDKEKFFIKLLFPQIEKVIEINNKLHESSSLKPIGEIELTAKIDDKTVINGKIDKTLIDDVGENIAVVDYKTGKETFNANKIEYGLGLQLPIYEYLLHDGKDNTGKDYKKYSPIGLFIQNICADKKDENSDDLYKLNGLVLNDINKVKKLDSSLKPGSQSEFISCLKLTTSNDFPKNSSCLISEEQLIEYRNIAYEQIINVANSIRAGQFEIRPISIDNFSACSRCPYYGLCFKDNNDVVRPKKEVK